MNEYKNLDDAEIVKDNYDKNASNEWERLEGFHFEFEIAKHFFKKYLRGKTVLDIGGGPGRYSIYLAKLGYDVTLVDLSEGNISLARRKFSEYGVKVRSYVCDARNLKSLNLGLYDNVLLMGPLYHLTDVNDRKACVLQAKEHMSANSILFASFITLTAGLNFYLDNYPEKLIFEPALDLFDRMKEDKSWSGMAFTKATFINSLEVEPFFEGLGFEKLALLGQEGIAGPRLSYIENCEEKVRRKYLEISLKVCCNPQYYCYSNHLLYIGEQKKYNI